MEPGYKEFVQNPSAPNSGPPPTAPPPVLPIGSQPPVGEGILGPIPSGLPGMRPPPPAVRFFSPRPMQGPPPPRGPMLPPRGPMGPPPPMGGPPMGPAPRGPPTEVPNLNSEGDVTHPSISCNVPLPQGFEANNLFPDQHPQVGVVAIHKLVTIFSCQLAATIKKRGN